MCPALLLVVSFRDRVRASVEAGRGHSGAVPRTRLPRQSRADGTGRLVVRSPELKRNDLSSVGPSGFQPTYAMSGAPNQEELRCCSKAWEYRSRLHRSTRCRAAGRARACWRRRPGAGQGQDRQRDGSACAAVWSSPDARYETRMAARALPRRVPTDNMIPSQSLASLPIPPEFRHESDLEHVLVFNGLFWLQEPATTETDIL